MKGPGIHRSGSFRPRCLGAGSLSHVCLTQSVPDQTIPVFNQVGIWAGYSEAAAPCSWHGMELLLPFLLQHRLSSVLSGNQLEVSHQNSPVSPHPSPHPGSSVRQQHQGDRLLI